MILHPSGGVRLCLTPSDRKWIFREMIWNQIIASSSPSCCENWSIYIGWQSKSIYRWILWSWKVGGGFCFANIIIERYNKEKIGLCVIFHSGIFHYRELPLLNIPLGSNQGFSTSYIHICVIIYIYLTWNVELEIFSLISLMNKCHKTTFLTV